MASVSAWFCRSNNGINNEYNSRGKEALFMNHGDNTLSRLRQSFALPELAGVRASHILWSLVYLLYDYFKESKYSFAGLRPTGHQATLGTTDATQHHLENQAGAVGLEPARLRLCHGTLSGSRTPRRQGFCDRDQRFGGQHCDHRQRLRIRGITQSCAVWG